MANISVPAMDGLDGLMEENQTSAVICDEDTHPRLRLAFISFGTVIAVVGCISNALLLYVFCRQTRKSNPFQTFLAFLDFMLCFLFIACFGALSAATTFRIEFLYNLIKDHNVQMLILSRIVQLSIPYVLILNTADRLNWIDGDGANSKRFKRYATLGLLVAVIVALRVPGYFVMEVITIEDCDFFSSKALSGVELPEDVATMYQHFDVIIQFFHLFVSFIVLFVLNVFVVKKLRSSHKRARRQSSCPQALNTIRTLIAEEEKREHKRLRCAIKTTIVLISSYLACNSVNFILYSIEMWNFSLTQDENGNFNVFYVAFSDLGTNLFVFSSSIRMFIFYMYNPDIRAQLKGVAALNFFTKRASKEKKVEVLLGVPL